MSRGRSVVTPTHPSGIRHGSGGGFARRIAWFVTIPTEPVRLCSSFPRCPRQRPQNATGTTDPPEVSNTVDTGVSPPTIRHSFLTIRHSYPTIRHSYPTIRHS